MMSITEVYSRIDSICKSSSSKEDKENTLITLILSLDFTGLQKFIILAYLDTQYGIRIDIPGLVAPRVTYN